MKVGREKKLEIALLKEKLEKISGKKVTFKEMAYGSDYEPKVIDFLTKRGSEGAVAKELISIFPSQTMSIPVLQRLLKSGAAVRDMSVRPGKWYTPKFVPKGVDTSLPAPKVRKPKVFTQTDLDQDLSIIKNRTRTSGDWEDTALDNNGQGMSFSVETRDRGSRTDHGGEDGDGHMDYEQIEKAQEPYVKKYTPILKQLKIDLKEKGYKMKSGYVDYGEKGHISLDIRIEK
jgi:hypothetical protein